jgi:hypothetical protein
MCEKELETNVAVDSSCNRALEVVAKRSWLSKNAYSVSKAVHAFAKPIRLVLTDEATAEVVQQLLLRTHIIALQLGGNASVPLLDGLSGSVAELPRTLQSFEADNMKEHSLAATQSVIQLLPSSLQRLRLSYSHRRHIQDVPQFLLGSTLIMYGGTVSGLRPLEWSANLRLPTRLQELYLSYCKFSGGLQLPATLRRLELVHCSSSSGDKSFSAHLNEGLQHAVIKSGHSVDIGSELPSTLTHLVLQDHSRAYLGDFPSVLQHLQLNRNLHEALEPLPSSLRVLKLGSKYRHPLGILPDTLIELRVGRQFDWPLGALPESLISLRVGDDYTQNLGPLPLQLEHLHIGKHTR